MKMGSTNIEPGGGKTQYYVNSVKTRKYDMLNKNVLKIVMVGIKTGMETEGYQVFYGARPSSCLSGLNMELA